jgi:integrase
VSSSRYGSGQVYVKWDSWYARWRLADGRRVNRKLGRVRARGSRDGLTKKQAERRLRALIDEPAPAVESDGVEKLGAALVTRLQARDNKPSSIETVESHIRVHLRPYFETTPVADIDIDEIERFIAALRRKGLAPKTIHNVMGTLHSIFELAQRKRMIVANPCKLVDKPKVEPNEDIRFLTQPEFEAVLRALEHVDERASDTTTRVAALAGEGVPIPEIAKRIDRSVSSVYYHLNKAGTVRPNPWAVVERPLYLMAAMTGMRKGELLALRWRDVDWTAEKVRVRQSYVRGQFGTPKSKRSSRGVPLALRLATELEHLHKQTVWNGENDLVFAHPYTGRPLDGSNLLKRFKKACERAAVRPVRFHDLRHTFGTRLAAAGVPLKTLQEWFGHRDSKTTDIYADYQPGQREAEWVERAFAIDEPAPAPDS